MVLICRSADAVQITNTSVITMIDETSRTTMSTACLAAAARAAAIATSREDGSVSPAVTAPLRSSNPEIPPEHDRHIAEPRWYPRDGETTEPERRTDPLRQ